jgi:aldehyde dehydrogenase (NAD+)
VQYDKIYVGGDWIAPAQDGSLPVINPATEEVIAATAAGSPRDVDLAATAAAASFAPWSQSPLGQRIEIFAKAARVMRERSAEITRTIVSEVGQPYAIAAKSQTAASVDDLDIIAEVLADVRWEEEIGGTIVRREPVGVVGAITPWNSPLHQVCIKAGAAIAAGCTVVLKPSEVAPLSSFILAEILAEAGLPGGVFNLVPGTGPVVGEAIATHPLVDMVSLTGSVRAGSRVMELASSSVKRVALELGGKSPNIIFADADFDAAVTDGVEDCFRNSGQVCGGLSRMLVPRELLRRAEKLAAAKAESYVLGDPFAPSTTLGPVTTSAQRDRVRGYIESGQAEGARMLTGGADAPVGLGRGYYVQPTVFSDVTNEMKIAREEIFGPVLTLLPFDSDEQAIAIANDSSYGLAAGVWSADARRAERVASRLRVGRVRINGAPLNRRAPHGGFKQSGIGREWGRYGIEEFLETKSVIH